MGFCPFEMTVLDDIELNLFCFLCGNVFLEILAVFDLVKQDRTHKILNHFVAVAFLIYLNDVFLYQVVWDDKLSKAKYYKKH